jgi:hypothetical protein
MALEMDFLGSKPTISRFFKAPRWVMPRGEDGYLVSSLLQGDSGIDYETFRTANA